MSDITREQWDELCQRYEQLRINEEMYRVAVGMTNHTITVVDVATHTLNQIYNEGSWTGVSVSMPDVPESVLSTGIIHPDDCEGYRQFYRDIYSGVPKGEFTMRVMEENRGWVWFTMYYQTVFDDNGKPVRAICFSDDITVKKRAEEHLLQFKAAVTADADFIWEADLSNNRVIVEERRFDEEFGKGGIYESYDQLAEIAISRIADPKIKQQIEAAFSREALIKAYEEARREITAEYPFSYKNDEADRWLRSSAYLMMDENGNITVIVSTKDITESHRQMEKLEKKAETDSLTGLFNRESFEMRAEEALKEYPDKVHGFLMMDVDDFKQFNDNYGHAFGDSILQLVARVLKETFRSGDTIGRVGGDEFTVLMERAGSAEIVAERAKILRRNLMDACRKQELLLTVTMSIGVAISEPGSDLRTLYLRADEAMYKSKRAGKDCFHIFSV